MSKNQASRHWGTNDTVHRAQWNLCGQAESCSAKGTKWRNNVGKTASVKWDKPGYHPRTLTVCSIQGSQRHEGSRLSPMQSEGGEDLELKLHQEEPVCQGWWPAVGGLRGHFLDAGWFQVLGRACEWRIVGKATRFVKLSWITTWPGGTWVGSVSNKHNPSAKSGLDACISSRITTVIHVAATIK